MNHQDNRDNGNQSIVSEGVRKGVTEGTIEGVLEDLSVPNAEVIKGGPVDHTIEVPIHVIQIRR